MARAEHLDNQHRALAAGRAAPQRLTGERLHAVAVVGRLRLAGRICRGHLQQASAEGEVLVAAGAGEEAEMANAVESGGQGVQQDATDELLGRQSQGLPAVLLAVVLPAKAHLAVGDVQDALVGDGDAVGVAAEVGQHAGRARERGLGVDDPLAAAQGPQVALEGRRIGEVGEAAAEAQFALLESLLESGQKNAAEAARENAHGQEETGAAGDPTVALGGEPAAGHDAMQVGVVAQIAAPAVQHGQKAELGAEVARVGGNLLEAVSGGAEEQAVQQAAVLQGERGEFGGQREHDMEVLAVEQFRAALGQPFGPGRALAFGAVAVATGAVADAAPAALVALFDLTAEGGGAALFNGAHDAPLEFARGATGPEGLAVAAKDIGQLEARPAHRSARGSLAAGGWGSRSSGLVAAQTFEQATCR